MSASLSPRAVVLASFVSALSFGAQGCGKNDPSPPAPAASFSPPPSAAPRPETTPPVASATDDGPELPTESDYEDEAERSMTPENLDRQLDELEREIGK